MVAGIARGSTSSRYPSTDVRVEHEVKLMDFTKWLEMASSPREVSDRHRIRSILGMAVSRSDS
jgi:hypothetical protein